MPSPHTTPGRPTGRPATGIRIVRELPLVLEPVTRDPFADGTAGPAPLAPRPRRNPSCTR